MSASGRRRADSHRRDLPYNIVTAPLVSWVSAEPWRPWYECARAMFEREVAERLSGRLGPKAMDGFDLAAGAL